MKKINLLVIATLISLSSFSQWQSKLGIGINDPQYQLDVNGDINISSGHSFLIDGVPLQTNENIWQYNGSNIYYNNGNLGIGTDSPLPSNAQSGLGKSIHIKSSTTSSLLLENTSGILWEIASTNGSNLGFYNRTTSEYKLLINSNGNIGIGEVSDNFEEKLVINGNVLIKNNNALILTSPNGTKFSITVDDNGNLTTTQTTNKISTIKNSDVSVYPNPVDDILTVNVNGNKNKTIDVEIYNINGKLIFMKSFKSNKIQINTSDFESGSYILKLKDSKGNTIKSEKIIK